MSSWLPPPLQQWQARTVDSTLNSNMVNAHMHTYIHAVTYVITMHTHRLANAHKHTQTRTHTPRAYTPAPVVVYASEGVLALELKHRLHVLLHCARLKGRKRHLCAYKCVCACVCACACLRVHV